MPSQMTPVNQRDSEWIDAFVDRLYGELPNVSPRTLRAVIAGIQDDKELRDLSGQAAAERWLRRSRSAAPSPAA